MVYQQRNPKQALYHLELSLDTLLYRVVGSDVNETFATLLVLCLVPALLMIYENSIFARHRRAQTFPLEPQSESSSQSG